MVVLLIIAFGLIVLLDWPTLMKTNQRGKTLILYSFLLGVAFFISVIQVIDMELVSPSEMIEMAVNRMLDK